MLYKATYVRIIATALFVNWTILVLTVNRLTLVYLYKLKGTHINISLFYLRKALTLLGSLIDLQPLLYYRLYYDVSNFQKKPNPN